MLGLAVLICFSFFLTERTTVIMKDKDILMNTVKEKSEELEVSSVNAQIIDDKIIPGISGKVVDIEKTYQEMKRIGIYNDNLVVYKIVEPEMSIKNNYDKYVVGGSPLKKDVSIIFKIDDTDNLDVISKHLKEKNINANFFISSGCGNKNLETLKELSNNKHVIGSLEENLENNKLLQSIIKIYSNQQNYYCYTEEKNESLLNHCAKNKQYTILPSITIKDNLLSEVMKNIKSGSIISININNRTLQELTTALEYIYSKGYNIVNLDALIQE